MPHTPDEKKKALRRVRSIRGQAEALERALEAGAECALVLQQIAAIRGAANALMSEVLESHIREEFDDYSGKDPRHAQRVRDMTTLVRAYLR
ncbi:regulator [Bordetella genomosp. 10]|uniref:Regulator n=1 Tax=Bordetella genomosp. 10 TaxID=1416804 RepID=A0A261SC76_9BORD|nr:metal-sensing transcriptional repressor [Bordetella genomosp. 10]OZI34765.1 regulator [Bordetella genomosp. 10]